MNQKIIQHLDNRCGTCKHWEPIMLGQGNCALLDVTNGPIQLSDGGALYTRVDFSCAWYEMSDEAKNIFYYTVKTL